MENVCICLVVAAISGVRGRVGTDQCRRHVQRRLFLTSLEFIFASWPPWRPVLQDLIGHIRHRVTDWGRLRKCAPTLPVPGLKPWLVFILSLFRQPALTSWDHPDFPRQVYYKLRVVCSCQAVVSAIDRLVITEHWSSDRERVTFMNSRWIPLSSLSVTTLESCGNRIISLSYFPVTVLTWRNQNDPMLILPPSSVESFLGHFLEIFPLWEPGYPIQSVLVSWDSTIQILKTKTTTVVPRIPSPTWNSRAMDLCIVHTLDTASYARRWLSVCPVSQTVPRAFAGDRLYWTNGRRSWESIPKMYPNWWFSVT